MQKPPSLRIHPSQINFSFDMKCTNMESLTAKC